MSTIAAAPSSEIAQPFHWLAEGWRDIWRQPAESLFYGFAVTFAGAVILQLSRNVPWLYVAAVGGFMLVAPMLATGLYQISRRLEAGEPITLIDSMTAWRENLDGFLAFAMLLLFAGTFWQLISAVLIAMFYHGNAADPVALAVDVLTNPANGMFFALYLGIGGLLAALVFAVSVITMPMLLDRRCGLLTAIGASLQAVSDRPLTMALWAGLIAALTAIGFATFLLSLIIIMPWLGHASWHAYRALTR
jgi:uncharacterized membrane protein